MHFPREFLDELRARLPVSEVVGRRVKLRKAGREWKGLSPFNKEKTPSFFVNDQKQAWFDFSSGKNGSIFEFLMFTEGLSFTEAVERLAAEAGMPVPGQEAKSEDREYPALRAWIVKQPYQVSIAYAARAALRALPGVAAMLDTQAGNAGDVRSSILLPGFRAAAVAWVSSKYPARATNLRPAAASAAEAAFVAASNIGFADDASACLAAGRAAAAAARAAADSSATATAAARSLEAALTSVRKMPSPFIEFELAGAAADMDAFDKGVTSTEIMGRELWLNGVPAAIQSEWRRLETALLETAENWDVWTQWYQSRLQGHPASESLEIARVRLPLNIWARGPRIVNAQIKQLIRDDEARRANPQPMPLDNIPSPFAFRVSEGGTIALVASSANWPSLPHKSSKQDHAARLDVCRTLARDLISDLEARKFQVRHEYAEGLKKYASRLPGDPGEGNVLLADAEARTLRNMFAAEVDVLSVPFAAKLKTFLEQHMGLRVFYPDISSFYRDVQGGRIEEPLPLDAIDGIVRAVRESTPTVFERSVQEAIESSAEAAPTGAMSTDVDSSSVDSSQPLPPKDPLGHIDPQKASDFTSAGAINGLWKVFLEGERVNKALEGWKRSGEALRPHVNTVLEWLHRFMGTDGGPPAPPLP
jgi:hypothetical protein